MSSLGCKDIEKVVIKTEPVDHCGQESSQNDLPLTSKSTSIGADDRKDDCNKVYKSSEIIEKVREIKRSNSSSDDLCTDLDSSGAEFDVKRYDKENGSYSHTFQLAQNHEDQKPSREELEIYSKIPSTLNSAQSVHTSKIISTLTHDPVLNDCDPVQVRLKDCTSGTYGMNLITPVVMLSRLSHSQLPSATHRRLRTSLPSRKKKCSKKRVLDSEIMKPILSNDGIVTLYQCESCNKVFNKRQTLRQHYITHTDRFACPYCVARCKSKGDLERHILTHTKEKPYHCSVCNTNYTRESILKKHKNTQRHQRASYEHENLAQLRKVKDNRKKSKGSIVRTRSKSFTCILCPKVIFSVAEYRKHARSHAFKYKCNICQKGCKSTLLLKVHKRSHSRSTNLSCKVCLRSFANFYFLKEHVKLHKSDKSSKVPDEVLMKLQSQPFSYPKPGRSVKISAVSKEFECDECHKTFFSKRHLTKHRRVHEETYICGICTKTFPNLPKLKTHLKLHERMLKCEICDIIFYDDLELKDHVQKLHVLGSDYTCRLCYDHFDSSSNLEHHMKDHAPTMLFSGKSLDESTLVNKTKIKPSSSVTDVMKVTKAKDSVGVEEIIVPKSSEKVEGSKSSDSDDDSILDSKEFYDILNSALDGSDDNLNDSEISDSDKELYSGLKTVLENEVLTSSDLDESKSEKLFFLKKPLFYEHTDIMKKHATEFERYSEIDVRSQVFKCQLCDIIFNEEKYLKNHLKCHVCEHCNKFYSDKEQLAAHKSSHVRQLLKHIKLEAHRLQIPKQKWKGYFLPSSESESELEDEISDKIDSAPRSNSVQPMSAVNIQHTLSHDEIVQANKHLFDLYACRDPASNIFACILCKRKYARPTSLTRHFKTHVCHFCNKFFKDKSDLLEHKYSHRKRAALLKVAIIGDKGKIPSTIVSKPNRKMFKKYSFVDRTRHVYRCTSCKKDFVRRTVLTRHLKTHICTNCDKFFEDKYDLVKHQLEKHYIQNGVAAEDELIDSGAVEDELTDSGVVRDDLIDNDAVKDELDVKNEVIDSDAVKDELTVKNEVIDSDDVKDEFAIRGVIKDEFTIRDAIKDELTESGEEERFSAKSSLVDNQIPNAEYSKTLDTQVFSVPGSCTSPVHIVSRPVQMYKNIAEKPCFEASTSSKFNSEFNKFITVSALKIRSTRPEERERPFECGRCGKRFLKNNHLKSHMTIHTGERPFICSLCGKTFGRSTILQKHIKTHTKECKICQASNISKHELDLHMEVHRTETFCT